MEVDTIILRDSADTQFDDLIEFEHEVLLEEVKEVVEKAKQKEDYTNKDIYEALGKLCPFTLTWIGQYDVIEY